LRSELPDDTVAGRAAYERANAGLQLSSTPILGNNRTGSRSDVMNFNINLTTIPSLPAATYTGTLTIQAQAL